MQQRLGLKLSQKPVLTQSLRQLVKLLALNKLDLKAEINQELSENPVLEMGGEMTDSSESEAAGSEQEVDETATPELDAGEASDDPFSEINLAEFFDDYLDAGPRAPAGEISEKPSFETFLAEPSTLSDHLEWQLSMSRASEAVAAAAGAVIGNLNQDGYLTASLEEIRETADVSHEDAEAGISLVQTFDPTGVGARDLRECLLLQLQESEPEDGDAMVIVRDYFADLENHDLSAIAENSGKTLEHVEHGVAVIKTLDPRPGQRYAASENRLVEPDVHFVKSSDGFRVALNEEDLPDVRLNRGYRRLLGKGQSTKEVRDYVRERYHSAIQLLRNIEQRRQTIRSVCEAIIRRQSGLLSHGIDHLRPMMIKDVAEEIGVHPSTVSRAVANKYAHTEHGVYELRFFFSEAVQGPAGASLPLMLLKRKVKQMIEQEDAAHPLTDDAISKVLNENGISVTRRTVAKYREDLGIASTHKRRRKKVALQ
jgi:RNA polymerase sigma-54 factor